MYELVFKECKMVTPTGIVEGDLGIIKGKIAKIGSISEKAGREMPASGRFLLPGVIDMHVHFRDPGNPEKEDFFTGSCAAAAGGVTTVIDMPNTNPPTLTREALEEKRRIAASKSVVNFGFYMGLSEDNLEEIKQARNIAGVKVYMGSSTGNLLMRDPHRIEELLKLGLFAIVHAENEHVIQENRKKYKETQNPSVHSLIRSPQAAYEAVKEILHLAKKHEARVHITHVSTAPEVAELHKFSGPRVSADATPHHLYLTQSAYADRGNFVKMNPPLRTPKDRQALWKGLREGVLQAVASDHAPHTKAEKEGSYEKAPAGVPGVETLLPLLLDSVNHGELTLRDVARLTSQNPARLLGLTKKGKIEAGFDADLVLVDMEKQAEVGKGGLKTKCGWSPFSGWKLQGWPVITVVNGEVVFEGGRVIAGILGREVKFNHA